MDDTRLKQKLFSGMDWHYHEKILERFDGQLHNASFDSLAQVALIVEQIEPR